MDKFTVLIAVAIVGFVVCWLSLRRIEHYLRECLFKLINLDTTADNIEICAGQISASMDKD
jgi:hypothetical protein